MYEMLSAKKYYKHPWAVGSVLLHNGCIVLHDTTPEIRRLYKKYSTKKEGS